MTDQKNPIQPLVMVDDVLRYKENKVVRALFEHGQATGLDMNELIVRRFDNDDYVQFAQLIGYSHSGASTLSYFPDEVWSASKAMHEHGISEQAARTQHLRDVINKLQKNAIEAVKILSEGDAFEDMPGQEGMFARAPTTS